MKKTFVSVLVAISMFSNAVLALDVNRRRDMNELYQQFKQTKNIGAFLKDNEVSKAEQLMLTQILQEELVVANAEIQAMEQSISDDNTLTLSGVSGTALAAAAFYMEYLTISKVGNQKIRRNGSLSTILMAAGVGALTYGQVHDRHTLQLKRNEVAQLRIEAVYLLELLTVAEDNLKLQIQLEELVK